MLPPLRCYSPFVFPSLVATLVESREERAVPLQTTCLADEKGLLFCLLACFAGGTGGTIRRVRSIVILRIHLLRALVSRSSGCLVHLGSRWGGVKDSNSSIV